MPASVPIGPRKLLEHATDLANHQGRAGRPRPVWLRRAVSAAYYAAFHAVTLATVRHVLPHAQPEEARHLADYDHRASFDKATTVSHVQQAARVLDTLDALTDDEDLERFLALVALHAQLR